MYALRRAVIARRPGARWKSLPGSEEEEPIYKKYLSPREIRDYCRLFDKLDVSRDYHLNMTEFNEYIKETIGRSFPTGDLYKVFKVVDVNCDGRVSADEFLNYIALRFYKKPTHVELVKTYRNFDKDNDGRLSLSETKRALFFLGLEAGNKNLEKFYDEADQDKDGFLAFQEFKTLVSGMPKP